MRPISTATTEYCSGLAAADRRAVRRACAARVTPPPAAAAARGAGLQPVSRVTGLQPVSRGTGVQPVSRGTGVQPVSGRSGFRAVSRGTGFQPVACGTGFQPVYSRPPLHRVARPGGARPALRDGAGHSNWAGHGFDGAGHSTRRALRYRRRGTALIFTLAILSLLALIGFAVLGTVRTERVRWLSVRSARARPNIMNQVVQTVRERLHADLWQGDVGTNAYLSDDGGSVPADEREQNEPFDAPGRFDRWLASTLPYLHRNAGIVAGITAGALSDAVFTGGVGVPTLVWPRVSYLGVEFLRGGATPNTFFWATNSRTGGPFVTLPIYGDAGGGASSMDGYALDPSVKGVPVMLVPPVLTAATNAGLGAAVGGDVPTTVISGSTTNVTIADARRIWEAPSGPTGQGRDAALAIGVPNPKFPYFDTNMDGELDLYDADGDGIPDSPLSFAIPYPATRPEDPKEVYAAIRIIDNSSMINVNTAMPFLAPETVTRPLFDETTNPGGPLEAYQRRGRFPSDVLLDGPPAPATGDVYAPMTLGDRTGLPGTDRPAQLTARIWDTAPLSLGAGVFNPALAYQLGGRRGLVGGTSGVYFKPFGIQDEAGLRRRFLAGPTGAEFYNRMSLNTAVLEQTLPYTLLHSNEWDGNNYVINSVTPQPARTSRYAADFTADEGGNALLQSGGLPIAPIAGVKGWRSLLDDWAPWLVRRPLLTTISYSSTRRAGRLPNPAVSVAGGANQVQPLLLDPAVGPAGSVVSVSSPPMSPLENVIAEGFVEKVDLNPRFIDGGGGAFTQPTLVQKAEYIARLFYAIYTTDMKLGWLSGPPNTSTLASKEREDAAWQMALNIVDYSDRDDEPTVLVDALGNPRYVGLEVQPFFSKIYVDVDAGYDAAGDYVPASVSDDLAVELLNPFPVTRDAAVTSPNGISLTDYWLGTSQVDPDLPIPPAPPAHIVRLDNPLPGAPLGNTPTLLPWYNAAMSVPGRIVIRNDTTLMSNGLPASASMIQDRTLAEFTVLNSVNSNMIQFDDRMRLFRQLNLKVGVRLWEVDSFDLNGPAGGLDAPPHPGPPGMTESKDTALYRNDFVGPTLGWTFTVDQYEKKADAAMALTRLGISNQVTIAGEYKPVHWAFKNSGFIPPERAFDSPGDLSRVMAIGTRFDVVTRQSKPSPQLIRDHCDQNAVATGRADFTSSEGNSPRAENAGNLWNVISCLAAQHDGINNDGSDTDGNLLTDVTADPNPEVDEAGEAARIAFRTAGTININTAPVPVLRAVPFMWNQDGMPYADSWDFASAIIGFREGRQSASFVINGFGPLTANAVATTNPRRYVTLADLMTAGNTGDDNNTPFSIRRFGKDTTDLAAHVYPGAVASPDFDAGDTQDNAGAIDDARERDIMLSRWGSILTTRSDVYTVYIALIDENGRYLQRSQFTLDRSVCAVEDLPSTPQSARPVLPQVLGRVDTDYSDDTR